MKEGMPQNEEPVPAGPLQRAKNSLGKIATVGAAFLMTSSGEMKPPQESFNHMKERAKREMVEKGITSEQSDVYKPGVNDIIYRAIGPTFSTPGTKEAWNEIKDLVFANLKEGRKTRKIVGESNLTSNTSYEQMSDNPGEEDSWRLYLGMPQQYGTYKVSDYSPTHSKENKYYFEFADVHKEFQGALDKQDIVKFILNKMGARNKISSDEVGQMIIGSRTMYHFQWSKGEDEKGPYLAYYDIWDLDVPLEKGGGFFGKPFEIYGRVYYNRDTFEILK